MTQPAQDGKRRKPKCNLPKQEEVVKALWDFAGDLQFRADKGCVATCVSGKNNGVKASLGHIGTALAKIMKTFGYEVTEGQ